MSLIQIESNIDDAIGWLDYAIADIADLGDDVTLEEFERYLNKQPELKAMYETLVRVRADLRSVWTPKLKKQLEEEEAYQSDMEDRSDAMSY